jgi:hypothetical protein
MQGVTTIRCSVYSKHPQEFPRSSRFQQQHSVDRSDNIRRSNKMMPFAEVEKDYQIIPQEDTVNGPDFREQSRITPRTRCIRTASYLIIEALILIAIFFIYDRDRAAQMRSPDFSERCKDAKEDRNTRRTEKLNAMDS